MDLPKKLTVSRIFYYPLKSGTEIETKEALIRETGIVNDRRFVILDKKTLKFQNIKSNKDIYFIQVNIAGDSATVKIPNHSTVFTIDLSQEIKSTDPARIVSVNMYNILGQGLIMPEEINKAISEYLKGEYILVYSTKHRYVGDYDKTNLLDNLDKEKDKTYFADLAPYLLSTEESLEILNKKLKDKAEDDVTFINFRPNIVISGYGAPYYEDKLQKFKIGNAVFRRIKGCVRCKITTFNTIKNKFNPNVEPLETLYEDRNDERIGGPVFGSNLCCDIEGNGEVTIKVGDEVEVIEWA